MNKKEILINKCQEAIYKIEDSLLKSEIEFTNSSLPKSVLVNVKNEILTMISILDKRKYKPNYPRFILDYPESELQNLLIDVSYLYNKNT